MEPGENQVLGPTPEVAEGGWGKVLGKVQGCWCITEALSGRQGALQSECQGI